TTNMAVSEHTEIVAVGTTTSLTQWTPVFAGALVASAVSLVLIAFGTAIGLGIVSSSPTWRDTSPTANDACWTVSVAGSSCELWGRRLCGGAASGTLGSVCA